MYDVLPSYGGVRVGGFHDRRVPKHAAGWMKLGIVRDPYDRALSIWWATQFSKGNKDIIASVTRTQGEYNFKAFCLWMSGKFTRGRHGIHGARWGLFRPMHEWYKKVRITHWLHTESLEAEFNALPFVEAPVKLPYVNTSAEKKKGRPTLEDAMTPDIQAIIEEWAGEDFETFGYKRRPAQCLAS
jgi:hypothetical protein